MNLDDNYIGCCSICDKPMYKDMDDNDGQCHENCKDEEYMRVDLAAEEIDRATLVGVRM